MADTEKRLIRDRIIDFRRVRAGDLLPDERNWRRHPKQQREALAGILHEIGYADALLVRETPGGLKLIDGHLRAGTTPDMAVPVLVTDLDEAESAKLLATLDPLAAMAETDAAALDALLRDVDTGSAAITEMLSALAEQSGMFEAGEIEQPDIPDGDRDPFRQMTFTLHDSQYDIVECAIARAKTEGGNVSDVNDNSNGNALAFICKAFADE